MLESHHRRGRLNPTLRVVFWVVHGEEQRQRRAHRLFAAATQAAVLHLASEQLPDDRLTRGAERTEPQTHEAMTLSPLFSMFGLGVRSRLLPTCCWLLCRPEGLPVPGSLGGAGPGWSGSSFGLNGPVWPCPSAHPSQRGSGPVPRLRGWFETLAGSYWPIRGGDGRVRSAGDSGHVNRRVVSVPDTDLLATNPTCGRGIQVHRPNKTPSDTDDSGLNTGSAPGNTEPNKPEREELNSVVFFFI